MRQHQKRACDLIVFFSFIFFLSHNLVAMELTNEEVSEIRFKLKGVVLFSGSDPFSKAIKITTGSQYSHVGLLVCDKYDKDDEYCFESTGSAREVLKGNFPHVRVTPWDDIVENYDGSIYKRHLTFLHKQDEPRSKKVTKFIHDFNGRKYETDLDEMFLALGDKNKKGDLETVFCSELAAEMFIQLGLLPKQPANNFLPAEFSTEFSLGEHLQRGILEDEIMIKEKKLGKIVRFGLWFRNKMISKFCCCTGGGDLKIRKKGYQPLKQI